MSEAKPRKPSRRKKADAAPPPPMSAEEERQLLVGLDAEEHRESMAGLIERATVLLKEIGDELAELDTANSYTGQDAHRAMGILVNSLEEVFAGEAPLPTVFHIMRFMGEVVIFRKVLLRMEQHSR